MIQYAAKKNDHMVKCLILFMYHSGARIQDAAALKFSNFCDLENFTVHLKAQKTSKRTVTLPEEVYTGVLNYKQTIKGKDEDHVFAGNNNLNGTDALRKRLKQCFVKSKWETLQSHDFRVSYVTNAYDAGIELLKISRAVGHSSIATTQIYVKDLDQKKASK